MNKWLAQQNHAWLTVFFLILGTSIGAGMMTLPLLLQPFGFFSMLGLIGGAAIVMYLVSFIWISLCYHFEPDSNLSTYVKNLAPHLLYPTHVAYLIFFWSLIAYYLSVLPTFLVPYVSVACLEYPVFYCFVLWLYLLISPKKQGLLNEIAVFFMLGCLAWIGFLLTSGKGLFETAWPSKGGAQSWDVFVPLLMFFGYHLSIPSFRVYGLSAASLKKATFFSAFGIFMIYSIWSWLLLSFIAQSQSPILSQNDLIHYLLATAQNKDILRPIAFFSFYATWTSCLGLSMGASAYLKDCMQGSTLLIAFITAMPPLILLYWSGGVYQSLLGLASLLALYLLILLPSMLHFLLHFQKFRKISFLSLTLIILALFFIVSEMGILFKYL